MFGPPPTAVPRVTKALMAAWLGAQAARPPDWVIAKQGAVAKWIAERTDPKDIALALAGIPRLFPYSKGAPWDLFDLRRRFASAVIAGREAAEDSPEAAAERIRRELGGTP